MNSALIASDPVVTFVIRRSRDAACVQRAYLFGSQARGNARPTSDYDFAFEVKEASSGEWAKFCLALEEDNPRLNTLDLIRLNEVGDELQQRILTEGIMIFSREPT